jgi:hypothetical protein
MCQILVGTLYLSLTYVNLIPASLTGLVVSRDLFLVYAGSGSLLKKKEQQ